MIKGIKGTKGESECARKRASGAWQSGSGRRAEYSRLSARSGSSAAREERAGAVRGSRLCGQALRGPTSCTRCWCWPGGAGRLPRHRAEALRVGGILLHLAPLLPDLPLGHQLQPDVILVRLSASARLVRLRVA